MTRLLVALSLFIAAAVPAQTPCCGGRIWLTPSATPTVTLTPTPDICSGTQLVNGITFDSIPNCVTQIPTATLAATPTLAPTQAIPTPVQILNGYDTTGGGRLTADITITDKWAAAAFTQAQGGGL